MQLTIKSWVPVVMVSWSFVSRKSCELLFLRSMDGLSCLWPDSFVRFISSIRYSMVFVLKPWCLWASLPGLLIRWNESPVGAGHDWPSVPGNELRAISGCNNQSFLNHQWGSCSLVTRYGWVDLLLLKIKLMRLYFSNWKLFSTWLGISAQTRLYPSFELKILSGRPKDSISWRHSSPTVP